jgi:DNA-binding CsgD family transcriptional regulator
MSTLQIEVSSPDLSVTAERYRINNEVCAPPQAPRTLPTCRASGPPVTVGPEPELSAKTLPLATAFLEDLRDAIVALDAQGHCLFVNRAFETMTGFGRSDLLGTPLCHKIVDAQKTSWSSLARIFGTPSNGPDTPPVDPFHSQFRMHRSDSSSFDVAIRWDRFPGSQSIAASFLLCKELLTVEFELQSRMMELRVLRDELNVLLDVPKVDENTAYSRWRAHTNQQDESVSQRATRSELSRREQEILHFVLDGKRVGTIAATLFLSENTVRNHLKRIYKKLGVRSLGELREHCSNV